MTPELKKAVAASVKSGNISVLTGAGVSAESGIPTFRGPEGYWTVGSTEYHPQEMATHQMFLKQPYAVWEWYLYRLSVCLGAAPNAGHTAIVGMEALLGDRFTLITQNVDGLHLQAGNSPERTFQIHGNVHYMRCAEACSSSLYPVPDDLCNWRKDRTLTEDEKERLRCPACNAMTRPHVLWFDEIYDEEFFKLESTLKAARETRLLIVAGTSGATNLPNRVAFEVSQRHDAVIVDVNIEKNPFTDLALKTGGFFVNEKSGVFLPKIHDEIKIALSGA